MIEITYSTDCYHHPQQHHIITTLEAEGTHYSYLSRLLDSNFFVRRLYKDSY